MRSKIRPTVIAATLLVTLVPATQSTAGRPAPAITLSATPAQQQVIAGLPCLPAPPIMIGMTGSGEDPVYADTFVRAQEPLTSSRDMFSSYVPAGSTVTAPVSIGAPHGAPPGRYAVTLESQREELSVPVTVVAPPVKTPGTNLLRGERADPSSTFVTSSQMFKECGAVDGDRTWSVNSWSSGVRGEFPATYTVTLPEPELMNRVDLFTNAANSDFGLRDWDVRVQTGAGTWQTVAQVRGNTLRHASSAFPTVEAVKVEIVGLDNNRHDYVRIAELEAYYDTADREPVVR